MSTAARKARKRSGEKAPLKKEKVPTPPAERSYVTGSVPGPGGTKFANYRKPRSEKAVKRFLDRFTPAPAKTE